MRQPRLLIVGCGDVGQRVAKALGRGCSVRALTSQPERAAILRAQGITPLIGNLDTPASLHRLGALAPRVLHLAPPPGSGEADPRTRHLLQALGQHGVCRRLVYGSTTGVYGDTGGARFDETRTVAPVNARARRRVAAESSIRRWAVGQGVQASILRIPFAIIGPAIVVICFIGAYTVGSRPFDLWLVLVFGALGYLFKKLDYPIAPLILAMVIGDKAEDAFRQSLIMSKGSMSIFWSNPLVTTLMALALALLLWPMLMRAFRAGRTASS